MIIVHIYQAFMKARNQLVINKNVNTPHLLLTICRTEIMKQSTERMAPEAAKLMHTIGRRGSSSVHASLAGKIKHRGITTMAPMIDKLSDKDGHAITPRYDEQGGLQYDKKCQEYLNSCNHGFSLILIHSNVHHNVILHCLPIRRVSNKTNGRIEHHRHTHRSQHDLAHLGLKLRLQLGISLRHVHVAECS